MSLIKFRSIFGSQLLRQFHTCTNATINGESKWAYVELKFAKDTLKLPLVWLRDHCRSDACYNWQTNQRKSTAQNLFAHAKVEEQNGISFDEKEQLLRIKWKDGHISNFKTEELLQWAVQLTDLLPLEYWTRNLRKIPKVSKNDFNFAKFSLLFAKYGVVTIADVPVSFEATKELSLSIAPIHDTFFGDFWIFGTDGEEIKEERDDTAYGNKAIGPHTDGTYLSQTPGIQVFHCLHPADSGGDTVLVDGFAVADIFRRNFPEYFKILTETPIEHHYLEGIDSDGTFKADSSKIQLHSRSIFEPVIKLYKDRIIQIRFNPYDRAPLNLGTENDIKRVITFYEAYEAFSQLIHKSEFALNISLKPGTVIFIDNFRVLHARTAFRGARKMCGCYLSRDGLLAKARTVLPSSFKHI
uniref:Trimethyllysine dioxygenase, mitochondrial n=1 Tax=Panagrolaimus superbus TaxID=310955 RepID=A0A914YZ83_9BILA